MSVRIQLDQHDVPFYTNLDYITGRVSLYLPNDATVSAVNVKLEGESRSRLAGPRDQYPNDHKVKTELEVHKLLYKVETVFPGPNLAQNGPPSAQYTLPAGQHEWPFRFKFPFNNNCQTTSTNVFRDIQFGQLNVQLGPDTTQHVKKALPPTLGGFPGEAEIKYFVKVTVVRPKFYQENLRIQQVIKFLPIEPPRPVNTHEETFARRQHQFQPYQTLAPKKTYFKKSSVPLPDEQPLSLRVDVRLPNPAILTCHQPVPLRILIEKLNESNATLFVRMLQIELISFTRVRAHDLQREETSSWILTSKANMNMRLENPNKKTTSHFKIPTHLWDSIPLPNTVTPSFETCNISRKYELEVRVGLGHGMSGDMRPELIVLPLRLPVHIYSGITPPAQLLSRLAAAPHPISGNTPSFTQNAGPALNQGIPQTPTTPGYDYTSPPAVGTYGFPNTADPEDVAPPSYEDAMAEDIAPVDGPRHHFETSSVSNQPMQSPMNVSDSKSSAGLNRHPSERLFPQNAPTPPSKSRLRRSTVPSGQDSAVHEQSPQNASPRASSNQHDNVDELTERAGEMNIGRTARKASESSSPIVPPKDGTGS